MKRQQSGFTLIELILVIVILGILAVIAVPQFVDLRQEARQAATQGVAGAAASAAAINFAACSVGNAGCITVADCDDVSALVDGAAGFTYAGTFPNACTVAHPDDATVTATFQSIAAAP